MNLLLEGQKRSRNKHWRELLPATVPAMTVELFGRGATADGRAPAEEGASRAESVRMLEGGSEDGRAPTEEQASRAESVWYWRGATED